MLMGPRAFLYQHRSVILVFSLSCYSLVFFVLSIEFFEVIYQIFFLDRLTLFLLMYGLFLSLRPFSILCLMLHTGFSLCYSTFDSSITFGTRHSLLSLHVVCRCFIAARLNICYSFLDCKFLTHIADYGFAFFSLHSLQYFRSLYFLLPLP